MDVHSVPEGHLLRLICNRNVRNPYGPSRTFLVWPSPSNSQPRQGSETREWSSLLCRGLQSQAKGFSSVVTSWNGVRRVVVVEVVARELENLPSRRSSARPTLNCTAVTIEKFVLLLVAIIHRAADRSKGVVVPLFIRPHDDVHLPVVLVSIASSKLRGGLFISASVLTTPIGCRCRVRFMGILKNLI